MMISKSKLDVKHVCTLFSDFLVFKKTTKDYKRFTPAILTLLYKILQVCVANLLIAVSVVPQRFFIASEPNRYGTAAGYYEKGCVRIQLRVDVFVLSRVHTSFNEVSRVAWP